MNQDIIDYLEGYWKNVNENFEGVCNPLYYYHLDSNKGILEYYPETNVLFIWSGLGVSEDYGYEVEIKDLQHLIQLEALL